MTTSCLLFRNAYSAHSENVLMSMLAEDSRNIRYKAVTSILKIRVGANFGDSSVRRFVVPALNYEADHYSEITDLHHKPIFTTDIASDEIIAYRERKMEVDHYPNHSQSVERVVKLLADAPYKVCGFARRDGFIRAGIASRNIIPIADTKADYIKAHF